RGGIPVASDGATVGVNAGDGTVMNYYLNWSKATFPEAKGIITAEKAQAAFDQAGLLELQYFRPGGIRPLTSAEKQPVILVYRMDDPSQGVIDAFTGEPIRLQSDEWLAGGGGGGDGPGMSRGEAKHLDSGAPQPLSPEEQKEVEQAAKLISRDEAVAAAKKIIDVPDGLTLYGANLAAYYWQDPNIRIWSLSWRSEKDSEGVQVYMSASVNAATGELTSFDTNSPSDSAKSGQIDRDAARVLADEFLKKAQAGKVDQVKLNDRDRSGVYIPAGLKDGENPSQQYFNFRRMVNGIPFPSNGMTVTVDAVNRKVIRYNLNWQEIEFPKPDGVLAGSAAAAAFFAKRPMTLSYALVYGRYGTSSDGRLVYQPTVAAGTQSYDIIGARTGDPLDYQGKPISQLPQGRRFNDVKGNFAEYEIALLGRAGLFGEYGDSFRPSEKVTVISLLRAMIYAKDGLWRNSMTDDEVIKAAKDRNWLKEDAAAKDDVTRELAAKLLARYLGLDQAARIEGIYAVPYSDARSLGRGTLGYVALTWGLGIITGDGKTFNANQPVTRAEAAASLVRTLKVTP
ncbi:MAG TPA: YcdB/YcdC domain-containing protein, partial [Bacillota bacterium]